MPTVILDTGFFPGDRGQLDLPWLRKLRNDVNPETPIRWVIPYIVVAELAEHVHADLRKGAGAVAEASRTHDMFGELLADYPAPSYNIPDVRELLERMVATLEREPGTSVRRQTSFDSDHALMAMVLQDDTVVEVVGQENKRLKKGAQDYLVRAVLTAEIHEAPMKSSFCALATNGSLAPA